jgi:oligopeptide transport system permease protein
VNGKPELPPLVNPLDSSMRLLAWLLGVHLLFYLGVGREFGLLERLRDYVPHFGRMWSTGALSDLLEPLKLTLLYLSLSFAATWALLLVLRDVRRSILQLLSSVPAFLSVLFAVFVTFQLARGIDLGQWLDPTHPWMLVVFTLALAVPVAARGALLLGQRSAELERARFSDVARAQGMDERRVRQRAYRVALPEGAARLATEALGLAASLMLIEGVLQFPGLGKAAFAAFETSSLGAVGYSEFEVRDAIARSSAPMLLLLLVAGAYQGVAMQIAVRLDPRSRA